MLAGALLLAALAAVGSCGGEGALPLAPPPPPPPAAPVQVGTIPNQNLLTGQATTLEVTSYFRDPDGGALTYTAASSAAGVVSVSVSGSTLTMVGEADGPAAVTVTARDPDGLTAEQSFSVTVSPPVPSAVEVTPETVSLTAVGDTARLSAEVRDQAGRPMPVEAVAWTSSDSSVATVDGSGLVTAAGGGTASVTATSGSASGSASVTVMQRAALVTVIPAADTIAPRESLQLSAEAFDANGHRVEGAEFAWTSSDPVIAGVTPSTGLVVALAAGAVTITATTGGVSGTATITVENPDRSALVALYEATGGPNWVNNDNWLSDLPLDEWHGVDTDGSGRVVGLDMTDVVVTTVVGNGLRGPIPPELGKLARLEELELYGNYLTGPIPLELGSLANLRSLSMGNNRLTGEIPAELGKLARLKELSLFGNSLTGPISPELGNLANLQELNLGSGNRLTGRIPPELGRLANLRSLSLRYNDLTGPVPPELGNLANLRQLSLEYNDLTGMIPPSFTGLGRMEFLSVSGNPGLCVPGSTAFYAWLGALENHDADEISCNAADVSALTTLHAATGGSGWTRSDRWLSERPVEEWHGIDADSLGRVVALDLSDNNLIGELPANLANLAALRELRLMGNRITGRLPLGFARLPLHTVLIEPTVCAPSETAFQNWWETVPTRLRLPACAALSDRDVLVALYHALGGDDWHRNDNWLSDEPLSMWYGVSTTTGSADRNFAAGRPSRADRPDPAADRYARDRVLDSASLEEELALIRSRWNGAGSGEEADAPPAGAWTPEYSATDGSVTGLDLVDNGLAGAIPAEIGSLSDLRRLDLNGNELTGAVPGEIGHLADLRYLDMRANELTGSVPPELGSLSSLEHLNLRINDLSGAIPPELGQLSNVEYLDISHNGLRGAIPAELGNLARLRTFYLFDNGLAGDIPSELGELSSLESLHLSVNELSGTIPPTLGNLGRLEELSLFGNRLEGNIPVELGRLLRLESLSLGRNELSGTIPPELGNLGSLRDLNVTRSRLSGQIPPELGRLSNLEVLALGGNDLSGTIPSELGNLSRLREIYLWGNRFDGGFGSSFGNLPNLKVLYAPDAGLAGPLPPSFGRLSALEWLYLSGNQGMAGALPSTLTAIDGLVRLLIADTGLCAPDDPAFLAWLEGVTMQHGVSPCGRGIVADAYLVQSVQSAADQVPLVAGRDALLRVFVTADSEVSATVPPVRASFYRNGGLVHTADIAALDAAIPAEPAEGSLHASSNAEIPAAAIRPGLEMVVEIDPEGTLDPALGIAKRIPASGRLPLDVREVPPFDVTVVPFLPRGGEDYAVLERIQGLTADDPLFRSTRARLPVDDLTVAVRSPVITSTNNMFELLDELEVVRVMDGGPGYYMGAVAGEAGPDGLGGVAFDIPSRSQMSRLDEFTIAHEFGHNLHLFHASCRGDESGPDTGFPYEGGTIGAWGYDFVTGSLVGPGTPDFMSYCDPEWVSPYHFSNALRWRRENEARALAAQEAAAGRMLLLWGNADAGGVLSLDPSFLIEGRPSLPDSAGDWRVSGEAEDGSELFSLDFHMPEVVDGDGRRSFVFAVPADSAWEGRLARIVLAGPGGEVRMEGDSEPAMAILRDAATGRVRGFLRDPPDPDALARGEAEALAAVGVDPDEIEVIVSRGVPDAEAWRR